jgi:HEPN domain-containing protein
MAEKYLKAVLQDNNLPVPKIHSLADLLALCLNIDPAYQLIQSSLNILEGYAVQFRYPGQSATQVEAKAAITAAKDVRTFIRTRFMPV